MPYKIKRPRKNKAFKWENRLTEPQREFVAQMNPMLLNLSKNCTPASLRANPLACERSYMIGLKTLCRAAQKYDPSKSAPTTYTYRYIRSAIFAHWKKFKVPQLRFELALLSGDFGFFEDEKLLNINRAIDESRGAPDVMADAELCEKALYTVGLYNRDFEAVLRLRYGFWYERDGVTYQPHARERSQIAEILNRSETWVKWAICRSLAILRVCLKEHG